MKKIVSHLPIDLGRADVLFLIASAAEMIAYFDRSLIHFDDYFSLLAAFIKREVWHEHWDPL